MNSLIERHLQLVERQVRRFASLGAERLDDLRGEGHLALVEAAREWSESSGVPFAAYAAKQIRYRLIDCVRSEGRRREVNITATGWPAMQADEFPGEACAEAEAAVKDAGLTEREKIVIKGLFYERRTLSEMAEIHKVSRERIRQLKAKALGKIKRRIGQGKEN